MARTRQDRRNDFDEFFRTAVATFTEFRDNDPRAEKFQNIYMLNICPGSRAGETNNRVVEVFWVADYLKQLHKDGTGLL
ncbi:MULTISPECIES: hypothetical protein [Emticicia]|uniref:hypothetical protein n=1 Tax=Emticicia TaxID=312278 RepID=UPI0007D8C527|nr:MULTISPECIES: hypothetical protein [Emticicia]